MTTKAQIRDRAAVVLGIKGEGVLLASDEASDLDNSYSEVYAQLQKNNLPTWDEADDIPDEYAPHVVSLVAFGRIDDYPTPNDRYQRIALKASTAILEIKELRASNTYITPTAQYF